MEGERVKLTIWDTAGQERFRTLTSSYYRGAQGVVLVYDATSGESFNNLRSIWQKELQVHADINEMVLMVVANKIDKEGQRTVSRDEGIEYAKDLSALYMECSAKTKIGVQAAFEELVHKIMTSPINKTSPKRTDQLRRLTAIPEGDQGSCAC